MERPRRFSIAWASVAAGSGSTAAINTISNYDGMGQITGGSQTVDDGTTNSTFSYAYNLAGALKSETYPSTTVVTTGFDGANRPSSLAFGGATILSGLSYAAHEAPSAYLYANGLNRSQTFNSRLQPTDMRDWVTSGGSTHPLLELGYTYGGGSDAFNNGNPTQIAITTAQTPGGTASSFTQSYAYDAFNRLCAAAEGVTVSNCSSSITGNTWAQQFSYDQYGNMQGTSTGSGIPALPSGTYNAQNQLTGSYSCTASSPPFDCSGNQLTRGSSALSYDAENRQTVDHDTVSGHYTYYTYDGMGERVTKSTSGGVSTVYVHDAFGNVAAEYSTGGAAPMACTTWYLSWDHLGSTRMVTDGSANVVPYGRHDYLPFGSEVPAGLGVRPLGVWPGTGSQTDYLTAKYTSAERDAETGSDFLQARYHANVQGRFMSVDPGNAGADIGIPQSWNGYSYVGNNPMIFVDPDGLSTCDSADCDDPEQPGTSAWICDKFPMYCDVWGGSDSPGIPGAGSSSPNPVTLPPWLGPANPPGVVAPWQAPSGSGNTPLPPPPYSLTFDYVFWAIRDSLGLKAPPMLSTAHNPYSPQDKYGPFSSRCMFKTGGDGPWGTSVRGCLAALYQAIPPAQPYSRFADHDHTLCYHAASVKVGQPATFDGYAAAIAAATGCYPGWPPGGAIPNAGRPTSFPSPER